MADKLTPPDEETTNEEAIRALSGMVEESEAANAATGACIYIAGGKQYCNNLSKRNCDALGGSWYAGQKCP